MAGRVLAGAEPHVPRTSRTDLGTFPGRDAATPREQGMSNLPERVRIDVQRILDREARRFLAEQLERKAEAGKPPSRQQDRGRRSRRAA